MSVIDLDSNNFDEQVKKSTLPVLVDFSAAWCGPCKLMEPIIEEIADEYEGKCKVCKLDVEQAQDIAVKYNVMSIPTLIIFKNNNIVQKITGTVSKEKLKEIIRRIL